MVTNTEESAATPARAQSPRAALLRIFGNLDLSSCNNAGAQW